MRSISRHTKACIDSLCISALCLAWAPGAIAQVPAFPGADGFGKYTTGGRGGAVYQVTNLADGGPGSLRAAIEAKGPRTVVFRTSGTIPLRSPLTIANGDLTIAGQTAPGDGICIRNFPTIIAADNIIIRFVRFRLGDTDGQAEDAMMSIGRKDIIIDHCSFSWGIDEVATFYNNENFTLQWCIITESLDNSIHPKGNHGYGGIWGGYRASFHHNLLAHHTSRNPRFQGGRWAGWEDKEETDFRNNVVFNWGFECMYGGERGRYNIVANYFKPGPASIHPTSFLSVNDDESLWFLRGNVVEGYADVSLDNTRGVRQKDANVTFAPAPFPFTIDDEHDAHEAFRSVLDAAGATLPSRDGVDTRIVEEVRSGRPRYGDASYAEAHRVRSEGVPLGIINSQASVGGWPTLTAAVPPPDGDSDGIPDAWETDHGLNPEDGSDGAQIGQSGYSNLEWYLNDLVGKK